MLTYNVSIEGLTPLLQNRPSMMLADKSKERKTGNKTPDEEAKEKLYELDGKCYQPATHIHASLVEAGKHLKVMGKGSSKATYSKIVGYAVEVEPFEIIHETQKWEVFSVLAVNPATKGRNLLHRPMFRKWSLSFQIIFDDTELSAEVIKQLLDISGRIVGLGDWRPAKKGRFGKFHVTSFKEAKETKTK